MSKERTAICPRCLKELNSNDSKCPNCGFQKVNGDESIYLEDLIDEEERKK